MVGLLKYFRRESKQKLPLLPDPKGNLSEKVLSSSIELTNNIVHDILDKKTTPCGNTPWPAWKMHAHDPSLILMLVSNELII